MDPSKISVFVDEYGKDIYNFCLHLTLNKFDAEEIYQQVFMKAFENADKIDIEGNPKSFLISICISMWKNYRRKLFRRFNIAPVINLSDEVEITSGENVEETVLEDEEKKKLKEIINSLNPKLKLPIILYYNFNLQLDEIAKYCKCPEGTVKSRLHKARETIKQRLEVEYYEK